MTLATKIAELLNDDTPDGRTIEEMVAEDSFEDVTIEKAIRYKDEPTRWQVQWGNGTTTSLEFPEDVEPKPGDALRLYPHGGLGGRSHGHALNGRLVRWETPLERASRDLDRLADRDRTQREEFATRRDDLMAQHAALPEPLRRRIDGFAAKRADFWVDSGWYEMFCCTEAAKFAEAAAAAVDLEANTEDVDAFWAMPVGSGPCQREPGTVYADEPEHPASRWLLWAWAVNSKTYGYDFKRQKQVLDCGDGHSGNTFGGAMSLAWALLEGRLETDSAADRRESV